MSLRWQKARSAFGSMVFVDLGHASTDVPNERKIILLPSDYLIADLMGTMTMTTTTTTENVLAIVVVSNTTYEGEETATGTKRKDGGLPFPLPLLLPLPPSPSLFLSILSSCGSPWRRLL